MWNAEIFVFLIIQQIAWNRTTQVPDKR